jgi:hypothetical protein
MCGPALEATKAASLPLMLWAKAGAAMASTSRPRAAAIALKRRINVSARCCCYP